MTAPADPQAFSSLPLSRATLANLAHLGYDRMTPIQAASLPHTLAGCDLIAQAKTGSGKTAAFALPLLKRIKPRWFAPQALVLSPTRELADQVAKEIRRLARGIGNIKVLTLCGGVPVGPQRGSLEHGAHVVVGTPGRILDHLGLGTLDLAAIATLVLDEADRMLDMGFLEDIESIAARCPAQRQTLLFSATYPAGIEALAARFLHEPLSVRLEAPASPVQIRQYFVEAGGHERHALVARLLRHFRPESCLAFCNTRQGCSELAGELRHQGIHALALHGEMEQRDRDEVLIAFANRSCPVLVATDVAARGLDIAALAAVINVDLARDPEVHVHRIGRTGRAGASGLAISLATPGQRRKAEALAAAQGCSAEWLDPATLEDADATPYRAPMRTLQIQGGRRDKLRPGDVLGALTASAGYRREQIGKIDVTEFSTYVAVDRDIAEAAARRLEAGTIKAKKLRVRVLDGD